MKLSNEIIEKIITPECKQKSKMMCDIPTAAIINIANHLLKDNPTNAVNFILISKQFANTIFFTPAEKAAAISVHFSSDTITQRIVHKRKSNQWQIQHFYLHDDPSIALDYCVQIRFTLNISGIHNTLTFIYRKSVLGQKYDELNLYHVTLESPEYVVHLGGDTGVWRIDKRANRAQQLISSDIKDTWQVWRTIIYTVHTIIENDWWTYRAPFTKYMPREQPSYPFMTYCFRSNNNNDVVTALYARANSILPPPNIIASNLKQYASIKQEVENFLGTRKVDSVILQPRSTIN